MGCLGWIGVERSISSVCVVWQGSSTESHRLDLERLSAASIKYRRRFLGTSFAHTRVLRMIIRCLPLIAAFPVVVLSSSPHVFIAFPDPPS